MIYTVTYHGDAKQNRHYLLSLLFMYSVNKSLNSPKCCLKC